MGKQAKEVNGKKTNIRINSQIKAQAFMMFGKPVSSTIHALDSNGKLEEDILNAIDFRMEPN